MAISCHKLKTAFFVPLLPGILPFKMFLHKLDHVHAEMRRPPRLRFIEKSAGYKTLAFDDAWDAVPDGYKRVAVVMDPSDLLVQIWRARTGARTFRIAGEADMVLSADLVLTPSLPMFLENLSQYAAASPGLKASLDSQTFALGTDLSKFDGVIRVDIADAMIQFFAEFTSPENDVSATVVNTVMPPVILQNTYAHMHDQTNDHYAQMQGAVSVETSCFMQSRASATAPTPVLVRGAASISGLHVVCMLKETPDVVVRFVDYYSALGCEGIHLYFDDPDDPAAAMVENRENVTITRCGRDFWGKHRIRAVEGRQTNCYNKCYKSLDASAGWLIVCDADEFVTAVDISLPDLLDRATPDHRIVRFRSGEAVWPVDASDISPFSAPYLRTAISKDVWGGIREKKQQNVRALFRRGIVSHGSGKYALRLGRKDANLGIHKVTFQDGYDSMRPLKGAISGQLVHFDAISFKHWSRKSANRATGKSGFVALGPIRDGQVNAFQQTHDDERIALFRAFYGIDAEEVDILTQVGGLYRLDIFDGLPPLRVTALDET